MKTIYQFSRLTAIPMVYLCTLLACELIARLEAYRSVSSDEVVSATPGTEEGKLAETGVTNPRQENEYKVNI